jgi:hypothetical protein
MAKDERIEMEILPSGMTSAITRLLTSIDDTAAFDPLWLPAPNTCE